MPTLPRGGAINVAFSVCSSEETNDTTTKDMRGVQGEMKTQPAEPKCVEIVYHQDGMMFGNRRQCVRNAGFGPDGKYCRQHAEKFAVGKTTTWYRASCFSEYAFEIKPVEVLEEKDKTLLVKEGERASREKKASQWHRYFSEYEQAIEFYRSRIRGLRANADRLEKQVDAAAKRGK
jgi:hypothetical protein